MPPLPTGVNLAFFQKTTINHTFVKTSKTPICHGNRSSLISCNLNNITVFKQAFRIAYTLLEDIVLHKAFFMERKIFMIKGVKSEGFKKE